MHGQYMHSTYSYYIIAICINILLIYHRDVVQISTSYYTITIDNFCVKLIGQHNKYYIEQHNDRSRRLQPTNGGSEECHQAIPTSSTQTIWTAELGPSGNSQTGIKINGISEHHIMEVQQT